MSGRSVDRFLTAVLMIDMVGSTELAAELGDRGWRELVQYEDSYRLCYVRGPEGIMVALAEQLS